MNHIQIDLVHHKNDILRRKSLRFNAKKGTNE